MGRVTSLFVHKVIRQVDESIDRPALLRGLGIDPDAPVDPKLMVSDTDYYAFLETIAAQDPNALDLPLRVGASMRLDEYGAMGLAWKSAANLRASWDRAEWNHPRAAWRRRSACSSPPSSSRGCPPSRPTLERSGEPLCSDEPVKRPGIHEQVARVRATLATPLC